MATFSTLILTISMFGMAAAIMMLTLGANKERTADENHQKAFFVAESGVTDAMARLQLGELDELEIGPAQAFDPQPYSDGTYAVQVELLDETQRVYRILSTGEVRGRWETIEVVIGTEGTDLFDHALFAGNTSGDPLYSLDLGGSGEQADEVNGDVYSGGDVTVDGDASVDGSIRAGGVVNGASGEGSVRQPVPDLEAMDYANTADYDVAEMFRTGATYESSDAGGNAFQMPEDNPAHIFRANPSDRRSNWSATEKTDFFLEDPYEPLRTDPNQDGSRPYGITLSGTAGDPGENGNHKVYYIDGNLWLHNRKAYSFAIQHDEPNGAQITFVVKGNVYFSDNLFYSNPELDGVAFIALKDDQVEDSGNIYFGDPTFGTLVEMNAYMYAENNFYDNNLDADGSATVRVNGIMSAGNHVEIDRDYGDEHSKLTVDFDDRVSTGALQMPGLPGTDDPGLGNLRILSWRTVARPDA